MSVPRLLQGDAPVPYGVAISAGTIPTLDRVPSFATIFARVLVAEHRSVFAGVWVVVCVID